MSPAPPPPPFGRSPSPASRGRKEWIGQSVTRLEDPPLVAGRGAFAGDINFPHQLHMRIVRSAHAHGRIVCHRYRGGARAARRLCGMDRSRHRRRAADRFPRRLDPGARSVSPAGAGNRPRALCRRSDRRGVCRRSLYRRGRRRSGHGGDRRTAAAAGRASPAGRIFAGPFQRSRHHPPGLWRRRRGVPRRAACGRS